MRNLHEQLNCKNSLIATLDSKILESLTDEATVLGNPLFLQAFWDSFVAAVRSNTALTWSPELKYLCAQLKGEASKIIAGFQLTNANYDHSVALLQECFGQRYKQIGAHMQALSYPSHSLSDILKFS